MPELFISYSRRDKVFVKRFIKALNENGYPPESVWVDWEDIRPSVDWEDEIHKGIESANSVIFILSPEWAASRECAKEFEYAKKFNKRMFPVVWEDVDPKKIQPELASLNWIFFRKTDKFKNALAKLLDALSTDLEWVKQHTHLLNRALEWDSKQRDNGYLLRGNELQEGEAWLSKASGDKQPKPTELQSEYVFLSRQDAVRRQRRNLIAVSVGMVVSIVMAIAAIVAGVYALQQSQRALASQLAAQSTNFVSTQPDLSLLLSLESNYIGDELNDSDPAWLGSLVTSLNSSPRLETYLRAHMDAVRTVAFSPDGKWMVSAGHAPKGQAPQVIVWDMKSNKKPIPYQTFTGPTNRILASASSPDGKQFAAAGDDAQVFVWDPNKCCDPVVKWKTNGSVRAMSYVKVYGVEYIVTAEGNQVNFWYVDNGQRDESLTLQIPSTDKSVRILSLAVTSDNSALAVGSEDGNVTVWDLNTGKQRFSVCSYGDPKTNDETICNQNGNGNTDVRGLAFTSNGRLISGSSDAHARLWNAQTGELISKSPDGSEGGHLNAISSIAVDPKGGQAATASWDNTIRIWQIDDDQFHLVDVLTGHSNSIWADAFSPDGKWLVSGSSDKTVILWNMNQVNQIGTPFAQLTRDVWALAASPNGKQLAAGDDAGNIRVWNFDGHVLTLSLKMQQDQAVLAVAFANQHNWLASAGFDKKIHVWDSQTGKELWSIDNAHDDQIWSLAFNPDDSLLVSASFDKSVKVWDTATRKEVGAPLMHKKGVYALTFNKDGTQLLVAGYENDIYVWDMKSLASNPTPKLLNGHQAAVNSLAFNPQFPSLLASTSDDKTLLIWNPNLNEHTPQVLGLNESMEAVTFSPNGTWLASATNNKTVLLWELDSERCSKNWNQDTCQPVRLGAPLIGHKTAVENVVFLSDTMLVSSSEDGQLIQWNLNKPYWYRRSCDIVGRSMSDPEKQQYIEGKISPTLLHTVAWFSKVFGGQPQIAPPYCLVGSN